MHTFCYSGKCTTSEVESDSSMRNTAFYILNSSKLRDALDWCVERWN